MQDEFITRFAPSPNGRLHLGHAYSALMAAQCAKQRGGQFLLRIEDIDVGRSRTDFITAIFDDLAWLGLTWPQPVMHQSARLKTYQAALTRLRDMGLLYPCWASRRDIAAATGKNPPRDPDGAPLYPGIYRHISDRERQKLMQKNPRVAWRLDMEKALGFVGTPLDYLECGPMPSSAPRRLACDPAAFGDVVLARKDIPTSYHLAVVVDDAAQNITQITRGADLQAATAIHRLLQVLLDLPQPAYFHHHLVRDTRGRRLSKSAKDTAFHLQQEDPQTLIALLPPPFGSGDWK